MDSKKRYKFSDHSANVGKRGRRAKSIIKDMEWQLRKMRKRPNIIS